MVARTNNLKSTMNPATTGYSVFFLQPVNSHIQLPHFKAIFTPRALRS